MSAVMPRVIELTAVLMIVGSSVAYAQGNPCAILTSAEAIKHRIPADKSEAQESLAPAVTELAKLVVQKVRSGK